MGIGVIASAIVLALAVLFANSYSTGLVAANARALHSTNAVLGSGAVVRAANNQAVLFSREAALKVASTEARDVAIVEAGRTLLTFEGVVSQIDPSLLTRHPDLEGRIDMLVAASESAMQFASDGAYEEAFDVLQTEFEPTWGSLRTELRAGQAEIVLQIGETESLGGVIVGVTRFLAILLLPVTALIINRRIAVIQARERRIEYDASLDYERKLNQSKDELIAGVSHQLRTPLTGIYGMADVLSEGEGLDAATTSEFAGLIRTEAYALDRMVADLLVTARLDAGSVSFKQEEFLALNAIQKAATPARRAGDEVEVMFDEPLRVIGDADRVVHVLRNLISNANKHGGPNIRIAGRINGETVEVCVEDDGPDELDGGTIFDGFANGGEGALTAGSVGLGLSVARGLAEGMGGTLTYERTGGANRFALSLPAAPAQPAPAPGPVVTAGARS